MIRKYNALIRYYAHVDPDSLTDEQWAVLAKDIEWARDQERKKGPNSLAALFGG